MECRHLLKVIFLFPSAIFPEVELLDHIVVLLAAGLAVGLQGDQTSHSERNQPRIFIGRMDAEAPILWPPEANSQLTGKDPDAGKDGGQEKKGATEDGMVGWHH